MLVHLFAALLQVPTAPATPAAKSTTPSVAADSTAARKKKEKKEPRRIAVTDDMRASAFRDPAARALLLLARDARMRQDSALQAYDATTYQRISAGMSLTRFGRDRLAFRNEQATKVRWRRGVGAYVEVTGSRSVMPIAGKSGHVGLDGDISPIPYYPGSESLWIGSSAARQAVDENEGIIHPLAEGSEAYYVYETGDSASFRLPDKSSIRLRELKIRPRTPKWNLAVGSLWFDLAGGQLVRAAYRMSVPMDIVAVAKQDDSTEFDDVPALVKPLIFPMTAQISAIGVEYGLYQGKFWLPRLQVAEGGVNVSVMRAPFKLEQRYEYSNVNSGAPLAPIPPRDTTKGRASGSITIGGGGVADTSSRASRRRAQRKAQCDSTGMHTYTRQSESNPNPVLVSIPCDSTRLANSPDLPASIYDKGDEAFSGSEIEDLVQQALSMGAQSQFSPQPPTLEFDKPRYNRIEGLSVGIRADDQLGMGYSAHGIARIGLADREPSLELTAARSDLRRTLSLTAYNRLNSASDWGNPLSVGSSLRAFLFGHDDGFYYRSSGLELGSAPDVATGAVMMWSLFAEQERTASQRTTFSLARSVGGTQFQPNIEAARGVYVGGRTRLMHTLGLDPQGFRLITDARLEAAHGDTGTFGRAALDLTMSHGIGNGAAALTVGGGTTAGVVPLQRFWFLGGSQTVRGEEPGTARGDAFWMARAELAHGVGVVRPVAFYDVGWAGQRNSLRSGTGLAGAGVGLTILDGLVRFDVAKGLYPTKGYRVDAYLEARF